MKIKLFVIAASLAGATSLSAQGVDTKNCPPGTTNTFGVPDQTRATQDACQKAIDLFQYMAPQLGIAVTGGNATLGQGGTLGGPGHFSFGLRVNALRGDLPQFDNSVTPGVTGATSSTYKTKSQVIGLPSADLALGIFEGVPLGFTNVGGLDLLLSASYLPEFNNSTVRITVPDGSLKFGYGARLGITQETLFFPGVSVSYLTGGLPKVNMIANLSGDTLSVNDLKVDTRAWRVVASKSLLWFGLALGAGKDTYKSTASIRAAVAARSVPPTAKASAGPVLLDQNLTRTNVFADASLNLPIFKITAEIGQVSGGKVNTFNKFSGKSADASRVFGSLGIRLAF